MSGVYQGAHVMSLPKFDAKTFLDSIRNHKPTTIHLVTPLISLIVNSDDYTRKEFEHTHSIVGGAAPIGKVLIERVLEKAEKYVFFAEGYGMTELSPLSHFLNASTRNTKAGSCGRCVPSTWSKIIDIKSGETLGPNCNGELLVKGPQVRIILRRNKI
jgi:4-coumarate--CoA ligase